MVIINSINELELCNSNYLDVYLKIENCRLQIYDANMKVIALDNAMSKREDTICYIIYTKDSLEKGRFINRLTISDVKNIFNNKDKSVFNEFIIDKIFKKSYEIFSPFKKQKKFKKIPNNWTTRNIVNAILSKQIISGEYIQKKTDSYYIDETKFEFFDFARDLLENRHVWKIYNIKTKANNELILELNKVNYRYVSLTFKLN